MPGGTCTFSYLTLVKSRDEVLVHTAHDSTSIEGQLKPLLGYSRRILNASASVTGAWQVKSRHT